MLERAANLLKRGVFPASRVFSGIGVGILILMVLLILAEILARRVLNEPIAGTFELTSLALILVVFLTLAYCAAKGGHIEMEILTVRFPKRLRAIIDSLMRILTTVMLGVATWQLIALAMKVQRMGQTSGLLKIDIYPFLYIAALGSILLTLVYLIQFLSSLNEVKK